jgi:hypothetical protein
MRKTIQALDGRVTIGYHTYSQLPLAAVVERMLAWVGTGDKPLAVTPPAFPHGLVADDAAITPTDIATAVNDLMAAHGKMPIASDMGDCLFTAMEIQHTALVAPGYYATMGFGVPAGLGLQAATNERPLILVGDGAFQMTGWELGNCRRYGWDPIVLVFNNASWEMLRTFQPESGFNDLGHWGFAEMAAGMGGDGVRVNTRAELKAALDRALATRGRFQLIDSPRIRRSRHRAWCRPWNKVWRPNWAPGWGAIPNWPSPCIAMPAPWAAPRAISASGACSPLARPISATRPWPMPISPWPRALGIVRRSMPSIGRSMRLRWRTIAAGSSPAWKNSASISMATWRG